MSYRFLQERVGSAVNSMALASVLIWLSAGGSFLPVVRWIVDATDERGVSWMGWFGFSAPSLSWPLLAQAGTGGQSRGPCSVWFWDTWHGQWARFPRPQSWTRMDKVAFNEMRGLIVQIILSKIWQMSRSFLPLPLFHFHISCSFLHILHFIKCTNNQPREAETETFLSDLIMFQRHTLWLDSFRCKGG